MKIQEKEDEVRQLAKDRTELQDKLTKLQGLVKNLVSGNSKDPDYEIIIEKKQKKVLILRRRKRSLSCCLRLTQNPIRSLQGVKSVNLG
jgi:predicted transcriptional regulator